MHKNILLEVNNLKKYFPIKKSFFSRTSGYVKAVDNVSFHINKGETLGLVGESGCGKTTLGRCILRAIEPTEGNIKYRFSDDDPIDITKLNKNELRNSRKHMQMILQDPYSSLDPRMTVFDIIGEPLIATSNISRKELSARIKEVINIVGLEVKHLKRYPHAFSGGQRQRIGIARALILNPQFIVADEAVSALDVSIQAQVLNLLKKIQKDYNITFLFIAHDLAVVQHISSRVGVMYVGKLVELAEADQIYDAPMHPYTEFLFSAIPIADPEVRNERVFLPGEIANPANPPSGCYFHPRCKYSREVCKVEEPLLTEDSPGHYVACHLAKELSLKGIDEIISNNVV